VRIQLDPARSGLVSRQADIDAGRATVADPRDAATVAIVRAAAAGPGVEVLMLRRTAAMKFAPGAYVFPGGSVDPADYDREVAWQGPPAAEFGARLGTTERVARALVCAAVRETFEEAGILLAGEPGDGPVAVPSGPSWDAERSALTAGELTLSELLSGRGLVLRADLLVPWARWITPVAEPRRFDTCFFAAVLPAGQTAAAHAAEADHVTWLSPAAAVSAATAGEIMMLPPTKATLNQLAQAAAAGDSLAAILRTHRAIEPVTPRLVVTDGGVWLDLPDDAGYPR
jgi:8-oxo-dGTP pyrophosphatase MutT (NUDIX family)